MNPSSSYDQVHRTELEGRELEASVLSRAAQKLNRCAQAWDQRDSPEFKEQLHEALLFNQRLWTLLQMEVAHPEHPMPPSLRKNLLQLGRHIDRTAMKLYSGGSIEDLESLISLNKEIAAGLLANGSASFVENQTASVGIPQQSVVDVVA